MESVQAERLETVSQLVSVVDQLHERLVPQVVTSTLVDEDQAD